MNNARQSSHISPSSALKSLVDEGFIKSEDISFLPPESPSVSLSRKRPRGSGVGKSIHKAAELPDKDFCSPLSTRRLLLPLALADPQSANATPRAGVHPSMVNLKNRESPLPSSAFVMKSAARRHTFPRRGLDQEEDDNDNVEPPKLRRSLATRGAVKSVSWKLRSPHASDINVSDDEGNTSSNSLSSSSSSGSAKETDTYLVPDPVTEKPPVPLVEAFEKLLAGCLFFQQNRKLPFLLRNLKKVFRIRCKKAGEHWPADHVSISYGEERETVLVLYRYTDPEGVQYGFRSPHPERECPLCSLMGILPSWSTLTKHLLWHHREVEFEIMESMDDRHPKILINLKEDKKSATTDVSPFIKPEEEPRFRGTAQPSPSSLTRSPTHPSEDELELEECSQEKKSLLPRSNGLFQAFTIPAYHNPSEPVISTGPNKTKSYRPTGPRLYDHLSSLPLDKFGPLSWFVLDKEEEIFELVDVLDEDKVMCALWARWILLNRSPFISDYKAGVEKFLDEYWPMIYKAAGWAAWRVWLLTLVSRGFLTNQEMVGLLKQYHKLREISEATVTAMGNL